MKKSFWISVFLLPLVLFASHRADAQPHVTIIAPQPLFSARIFYVSDLDLLRQGGSQQLFSLHISTTAPITEPYLRATLRNGAGEQLAAGNLRLSDYGNGPWTITNINITSSHGNWETSDNLSSRYQTQILRTGMIPADIYTYRFQVYAGNPASGGVALADYVESSFTVLGLGYLTLRYPDNDPGGSNPIMTPLPFFAWNSSQTNFTIRIAEIHQGETPEGALNSRENCEQQVAGTSFQYPSAGVVPLDPGKFYAWKVTTSISTSNGNVEIPSEIRVFRIAPVTTPESQQLLAALGQLLTTGNGPQLLQMIQRGQLGGQVYLGDQLITVQQLFSMLPEFNAQHYTIHALRVE